MSDASFDFSELNRLAADLEKAGREVRPNVVKATHVTARKIKDRWREKLRGSSTLPALPGAVSYDVRTPAGAVEGEIGFDKGRKQGPLGTISEFGTPTVAPRGFGIASLEENQEDYVIGLEKALDDTLRDSSL